MAGGIGEKSRGGIGPIAFVSYASQDSAVANTVVDALELADLKCWIAPRDVVPGAIYASEIVEAINAAPVLVLILSRHSVASTHVGKELERASSKHRRIVALRTDAVALPPAFEYFLSESQWIEVGTGGIGAAAEKLVEAVRRHLGHEAASIPQIANLAQQPPDHQRRFRQRWVMPGIAVLLVALIAATASWKIWFAKRDTPLAGEGRSIAVLPFEDMSPEHNQEYFSDGLAEELMNQLARKKELRVAGRTSSFSFKGKNETLRVIGEKLGVRNILEGSVRKEGNHLRINAKLIDSKDESLVWSQTFDRELSGVFAVQEDIAKAVAAALSITLDVGETSRSNGGTTNVGAYEKYLQATALFNKADRPENYDQAALMFREALALDPGFARAWFGLYYAKVTPSFVGDGRAAPTKELNEALGKLEELAPNAWWTKSAPMNVLVLDHKWLEADAALSSAAEIAPANEFALPSGNFLAEVGRVNEAVEYLRLAVRADPLSPVASLVLQGNLDAAGRWEEAEAEEQRFAGSSESTAWKSLGNAGTLLRLWSRKDVDVAAVKALLGSQKADGVNWYGVTADNWRDRKAASAAIKHAFEDPARKSNLFFALADHYGEKDIALATLRQLLVDLKLPNAYLLWRYNESGLRADPRFKDILRDLGLATYYRTSGKWPDFCSPVGTDDFQCH